MPNPMDQDGNEVWYFHLACGCAKTADDGLTSGQPVSCPAHGPTIVERLETDEEVDARYLE
jgi:hypothetical protein